MQVRSLSLALALVALAAPMTAQESEDLELDGVPPGAIIAFANQGKVQDVAEASPSGSATVPWDAINFGKPPQELDQLAGQEVTAYDCEGNVVLVLEGEPVPEDCDEDRILAVFVWGQAAPVMLASGGRAPGRGPGEGTRPGAGHAGEQPEYGKGGRFGIGYETTFVRGGLGFNRFEEESLDGFCDQIQEACSVTTNQIGPELAVEIRMAVASAVTAGLILGWTDLDGAEIEVGSGQQAFEGYFRASALFAQLALYLSVLEDYPWLRPFVLLGLTRWSAESGSRAGSQSSSQDDSGSGLLYGAGVALEGLGPGEVVVTLRSTGLESEEHPDAPVDNSVTQFQVAYALSLARIRSIVGR